MEAYNGGVLFRNSPGATAREIALLGLNAEIKGDVDKSQISARGKDLATPFLLSSDMRRYGERILSLKNNCEKQ